MAETSTAGSLNGNADTANRGRAAPSGPASLHDALAEIPLSTSNFEKVKEIMLIIFPRALKSKSCLLRTLTQETPAPGSFPVAPGPPGIPEALLEVWAAGAGAGAGGRAVRLGVDLPGGTRFHRRFRASELAVTHCRARGGGGSVPSGRGAPGSPSKRGVSQAHMHVWGSHLT